MKGPNKVEPSAVTEVFIKAYNLENTVRILGDLYLDITDVEAFNGLYVGDNQPPLGFGLPLRTH